MQPSSKRRIAIVVLCSGGLLAASCGGSADELIDQASDALNEITEEGSTTTESEGLTSGDLPSEETSVSYTHLRAHET